jgi:hypothetical protein
LEKVRNTDEIVETEDEKLRGGEAKKVPTGEPEKAEH